MHSIDPQSRSQVGSLAKSLFAKAFEDWSAMFGVEISIGDSNVRALNNANGILERLVPHAVYVETQMEGPRAYPAMFVFPGQAIATAVHTALMLPAGDEEPRLDPEDPNHQDSAQELMNLFCGSATQALAQEGSKWRVSQSVDHLRIHLKPEGIEAYLPGAVLLFVQLETHWQEQTQKSWLLLPVEFIEEMRVDEAAA